MKVDRLYDLENNQQIRVACQWIYSKRFLLEDILVSIENQIAEDNDRMESTKERLQLLDRPFDGYINVKMQNFARAEGNEELLKRFEGYIEVSETEKKYSEQVNTFIESRGYQPVKWARCTYIMTMIFLASTMLVHFYKADFVNLTVCSLALFFLQGADRSSQGWFRLLVFGVVLSMGYDLVWFLMRSSELMADDDGDGAVERVIRKFSLSMAIISFLLKFIMCFVYWMTSINYADLLDERANLLKP
jgi:hypothetical protein